MSILEAISPTARDLLRQRAIIDEIVKRDTTSPFRTHKAYRAWLQSLELGDLIDFYKVILLEHPKRKGTRP